MSLNGEQIKTIRAKLGLTQAELARELYLDGKYGARTVRRWENDEIPITGPACRALEEIAKRCRIAIP